ncbi:response regulator transcription factor [Aureispira anguillae]|uniref:Response regulatory domain-containing protein n=1 Tax=Aureispira anguillae TaxID=2864201 RepID=A0A915YFI1_9BACT|nr:hypothetical protein [Aureispira anguillae]BDS12200.1 hypothetical protein AsAng_0029150 [Aureispira anguillae]
MKKNTILILKDKQTTRDNIQSNLEEAGYAVITTNSVDIALQQKGQIALAMIDVSLTGCTKIEGEQVNEQLAGILLASKLQTAHSPAIILRTAPNSQSIVISASKEINATILDIGIAQSAILKKVKELIPNYPIKKFTSYRVMQKRNPSILANQNPILPKPLLDKKQEKIGLTRKPYYKKDSALQLEEHLPKSNSRPIINGPTICKE